MPSIYNTMPELRGETGKIALVTLVAIIVIGCLMKFYKKGNDKMIIKAHIYKIEKERDSIMFYYNYILNKTRYTGKEVMGYTHLNEDSLLTADIDLVYNIRSPEESTLQLNK